MSARLLIVGALLLTGCWASHRFEGSEPALDGSVPSSDASRVDDVTRPGSDGRPVRCFDEATPTIAVGPEAGCVELTLAGSRGESCASFDGLHAGAPVRILRASVGRVDVRARCDGCEVFGLSPDSCGGCSASPGGVLAFPNHQVDGLAEMLVAGPGATVEVCFDPDYGPPPWDP